MTTVVIMPGGFHPFHAGHAALYQSARRTFPDADVYVAATNDTSTRPFPFQIKEKLAQLAGVDPGRFMQVKSPFQAAEITAPYDPARDQLIFVRSEKDANKPPQAGGVKKNGDPSYLQPLLGAKKLEPFAKHAYMAYLPTVEFGPGMTSATEIRAAWPELNEKRRTALVMSLYPKTQTNPKLAATVVKMLDTAIGTAVTEDNVSNVPLGHQAIKQSDGSTRISKIDSMSSADYRKNMGNYKAQNWTPDKQAEYARKMAPGGSGYTDGEKLTNYQNQVKTFGSQAADAEMLKQISSAFRQGIQEDYVEERRRSIKTGRKK
jgi:hypothetical protein